MKPSLTAGLWWTLNTPTDYDQVLCIGTLERSGANDTAKPIYAHVRRGQYIGPGKYLMLAWFDQHRFNRELIPESDVPRAINAEIDAAVIKCNAQVDGLRALHPPGHRDFLDLIARTVPGSIVVVEVRGGVAEITGGNVEREIIIDWDNINAGDKVFRADADLAIHFGIEIDEKYIEDATG